jgi:hypothetical protein
MTSKLFHIGDIGSVVTERMMSPRQMAGLYDILNYMSGDDLYTHQLPRVSREAKSALLQQHPQLQAMIEEAETITRDNWQTVLDGWVKQFGKELPVSPMNLDQHENIDPISEAAERMHPDRIIVIKV